MYYYFLLILLQVYNSGTAPMTYEDASNLIEKSIEWSPNLLQCDTNTFYKIEISKTGLIHNFSDINNFVYFGQNFKNSCEPEFQPMIREQIDFSFIPNLQVYQRWRKEDSYLEYIKLDNNKDILDIIELNSSFEVFLVFNSKDLSQRKVTRKDCNKVVNIFKLKRVLIITIDYTNKIINHSKKIQNEKIDN